MAAIQEQVEYAALKVQFIDGVQATLSVVLINGDGEDPADVFGKISGRFGISSQFVLFERSQNEYIPIRPNQNIPLRMQEVVVPTDATALEITALLYDYDSISPNDEIANGTALFQVREAGQSAQQDIPGRYGSIRVNVTWG